MVPAIPADLLDARILMVLNGYRPPAGCAVAVFPVF
jgi:hypothetical protein